MEKQIQLFSVGAPQQEKYSNTIRAPIYEPSHEKPHILELVDYTKVKELIRGIDKSSLSDDEKDFLRAAAWRHAVFNYERIADYYAHASEDTQRLMERSALVIVDFDKAIEGGFVALCDDIRTQYLEEYGGDAERAS